MTRARRLGDVPQSLIASPRSMSRHDAPAQVDVLANHVIINLSREVSPETWLLESLTGQPARVAVKPTFALHDPGVLIDLVVQGVGIGIAPQFCVIEAIARGELVHVLPDDRRALVPILAVYPSRLMLAPKVRVVVDFAADVIGAVS
ncbi:MAG: LysR substrate-binding domain-containing protein [Hyphomicrobiales bacterium]|nr:LysR substrate-binding domain-containing protein [Hyphomicrobiales bacterium]